MFGVTTEIQIHNKEIAWFEPILTQWLRVHRDYLEAAVCEDSLYWYNERANVSALAGAAWRCGAFALEEFNATKGINDDASHGRVDFFIYYDNKDALFEAKQKWVYLAEKSRRDFTKLIDEKHQEAINDIKRTQASFQYEFGFALTFLPTYSKDENDVSSTMNEFHNAVSEFGCDFFAWFHNSSGKSLVNNKGEKCDAIALIGTLVRHS